MGVNFKDLGLNDTERTVREAFATPDGVIEIYEPSAHEIDQIINLQSDKNIIDNNGFASFDGLEVIKHIFPLLTNIDMSGLSEEEIEKVIENPKIHLIIAQNYVVQIINEINKAVSLKMKTNLLNSDNLMDQVDLINQLPEAIVALAKQSGGEGEELAGKVERLVEEISQSKELEDDKGE
jgi:hypothetical protein